MSQQQPPSLSHDELYWLIGQKEATILLLQRQMQAFLADYERTRGDLREQVVRQGGET